MGVAKKKEKETDREILKKDFITGVEEVVNYLANT